MSSRSDSIIWPRWRTRLSNWLAWKLLGRKRTFSLWILRVEEIVELVGGHLDGEKLKINNQFGSQTRRIHFPVCKQLEVKHRVGYIDATYEISERVYKRIGNSSRFEITASAS
jgi:hypothetical protein